MTLPKPYYQDNHGVLYHGDCLEIMKDIPDKSVDLVLTDIPFNVNLNYEEYEDKLSPKEFQANCSLWFRFMKKIGKRVISKIPTKNSPLVIPIFDAECEYLWTVIQSSPNATSHGPFNLALYAQYLVSKGEGKVPCGDLFVSTKNNIESEHPAEMPVAPIMKLLNMFSEENALILDPFAGSGTTLRAAKDLGRKYIGIEISEKYCEIIAKRMGQEVLF